MKYKTKNQAIKFASWLNEQFPTSVVYCSYRDLGRLYGNKARESVRLYIHDLIELGVISVEKISSQKNVLHLNVEKLRSLLNNERG